MNDIKKEITITDGTSQEDRFPRALKEGYIHVDEMAFEDLLAMGADYGRMLKFYNLKNEPDGDWVPFFTSDEAVIIAMILTTDLGKIKTDFLNVFLKDFFKEGGYGDYKLTQIPNYHLAKKIDFWFKKLKTTESEAGKRLCQEIKGVIENKLREELHLLESFLRRYNKNISEKFKQDFNQFWFYKEKEKIYPPPPLPPSDNKSLVERFLKSNFHSFYNTILLFKESAKKHLPVSLKSETHSSAMGLYIAFITLFQKAQQKINTFTQTHLDFYYNDILKVQPCKILPDSAYLILHPDGEDTKVLIKEGTEFTAGIDENNKDVIYTADNDLLVHSAKVESLYTLYFERNPLTSPEKELCFVSGAKANKIPVLIEKDSGEGKELKAHPLFGAPKTDTEQRLFQNAELGFAVASPVLLLKEGERNINILFRIEYSLSEKEENLNDFPKRLKDIIGTNEADAFFRAFRHMFTICLTTENGWYEVCEYLPLIHVVDKVCEKDCLKIQIHLSPEVESIVPYSRDIHGKQYDTDLPLIRFIINPAAYLYPYSLLKNLIIKEIEIQVGVKGVKDLLLYNNLGQLDPNNPFNPFGPVPSVGSYFIVGNSEIARKHITGFEVDVEWGDLPLEKGGFKEYYRAYELPFDNSVFEAGITVLKDGRWLPYEENEQPRVRLFGPEYNRDREDGRYGINKRRRLSCGDVVKFFKAIEDIPPVSGLAYDSQAKGGFFKFTLTSPEYAFGHKDYPHILTSVLTANARLKKPRFFKPVPNLPYTPLINVISINYTAISTINLEQITSSDETLFKEKIFHIHPFGIESLLPAAYRKIPMLPQYDSAGNLFIGLSAREFSGMLTLFFHLREDSTPEAGGELSEFKWYYLASNQWQRLAKLHVISDTTNGFLSSGIVTLNIPDDINRENTIMPGNFFWLRVSVDNRPEILCSVYSVHTHALKVRRQYRENSLSHLKPGLPAGTIKESRISIPGIGKINQIVDSFGGRPQETGEHLKTRISERLKHKNRATVPWDYERLILERFPEIFKVKCFANMVAEPENCIRPGHILIVVIPYLQDPTSVNLKPMVNSLLLKKIKDFVKKHASPFAAIEVRNPAYEQIQIRCRVKFSKWANYGYYINKLNQAITDYISPWSKTGYGVRFGWRIRRYDIQSYIRDLDYIDFVTNFSMLRIADDGKGCFSLFDTVKEQRADKEVRPLHPWSIAIPFRRHFIETMDRAKTIAPKITGIDELEVGSTFIITEN